MKKSFIGVAAVFALSIVPGVANAALSFNNTVGTGTITESDGFNVAGLPTIASGGTVQQGELDSNGGSGTITFTYLGHESGFTNQFQITIGSMASFNTGSSIGAQVTLDASTFPSGAVPFTFSTTNPTGQGVAINGGSPGSGWTDGTSIALIGTNMTDTLTPSPPGGMYTWVIGFDDSGCAGCNNPPSDHDWDDIVVGVNFVSAVPEPEIYAMMGVGLLLMGFVARRRNLF